MSSERSVDVIQKEWEVLSIQWKRTSMLWLDVHKSDFEQEFWQKYAPFVRKLQDQIEEMEHLLEEARRELV